MLSKTRTGELARSSSSRMHCVGKCSTALLAL
jgi:hypothetical protein